MDVWVHGCMDVWVYMVAWLYVCMGEWAYGCMCVWVYGCMWRVCLCVWAYGVWAHGCNTYPMTLIPASIRVLHPQTILLLDTYEYLSPAPQDAVQEHGGRRGKHTYPHMHTHASTHTHTHTHTLGRCTGTQRQT